MTNQTVKSNPYFQLPISFAPEKYYGSREIVKKICNVVSVSDPAPIEVIGLPGMGKSTMVHYLAAPQGAFIREQDSLFGKFRETPHLLFPVVIDFKLMPTNLSPFDYIQERFLEAYEGYSLRTSNEFKTSLPKLLESESAKHAKDAPDKIEAYIRELKPYQVRPVLILDDFDLVFSKMNYVETIRMRPWRAQAAFVICTEKPINKVNDEAAGSPFFSSILHEYISGLTHEEQMRLITEPAIQIGVKLPENDIEFIMEQVGNHPYLLILACKHLWDLRDNQNILSKSEQSLDNEHKQVLKALLKSDTDPIFKLYLNHLEPHLQTILRQIAKAELRGNQAENLMARTTLVNYSLVYRDEKREYKVFSALFKEFLTSTNITQITGTETQKAPSGLSSLEKRLLEYLLQNTGQECTFEMLSRNVWGIDLESNQEMRRRIQVTVSRLRDKLRTSEEAGQLEIISLRGTGYKISEITQ